MITIEIGKQTSNQTSHNSEKQKKKEIWRTVNEHHQITNVLKENGLSYLWVRRIHNRTTNKSQFNRILSGEDSITRCLPQNEIRIMGCLNRCGTTLFTNPPTPIKYMRPLACHRKTNSVQPERKTSTVQQTAVPLITANKHPAKSTPPLNTHPTTTPPKSTSLSPDSQPPSSIYYQPPAIR